MDSRFIYRPLTRRMLLGQAGMAGLALYWRSLKPTGSSKTRSSARNSGSRA